LQDFSSPALLCALLLLWLLYVLPILLVLRYSLLWLLCRTR